MRTTTLLVALCLTPFLPAAEVESRVLTHYVPQDFLENAVRTEKWTEFPVEVNGGLCKGDVVRLWTGGVIDYGNGDQPGENFTGPEGIARDAHAPPLKLALSPEPGQALALLIKTEGSGLKTCLPAGKPLEIPITKDKEKLWIGFNDEPGHYRDNHLGRGRRHELDPLWMRVEVVRTIVD